MCYSSYKLLRKRINLFVLIIFLFNSTTAQRVFVNALGIYELTGGAGTCNYSPIVNQCGSSAYPYNMAVYKDTIYYTSGNALFSFKIGVPNSCTAFPGVVFNSNSLTVDRNGMLYSVGTDLQRYNPYTHQMENLGPIPSSFQSAGDLLFYGDKLLLAGIPGGIYEINIDNPAASTLYMSTGNLIFFGFISYPVACGTSRFFGLGPGATGTDMYELDLVNRIVIGNSCVLPLNVADAGSSTESGLDATIQVTNITLTPTCTDGSIHVSAFMTGQTITYTLDNNNSNTTGIFNNVPLGSHHINMSTGACSLDSTVLLTQLSGISISSIQKNDPTSCDGDNGSITINATSASMPITYTIQPGNVQQSSGSFTNLSAGTYHISIASAAGCVLDTSVTLSYHGNIEPISTAIKTTDPVCSDINIGSIKVSVNGIQAPYTVLINGNIYSNDQLITGLSEGLYSITILNKDGCIADTTSRTLILRYEPPCTVGCINTKNAFTPNGDGNNDLWYVYDSYSCLSNVAVTVFNRYGSKVFESSDYKNTWDGHYKNKQLPDGTYFAVIQYKLVTGRKITIRTDVTILR